MSFPYRFWLKLSMGFVAKHWVAFRPLARCCVVLQVVAAMPTTWYYISGCPLPEECNAHKTVTSKKKSLTFSGLTIEDAVEKCAQHLMQSSLHKLSKAQAFDIAQNQAINEHEEEDKEEEEHPMPVAKARRLALEPAEESDPLVADIGNRVAELVRADFNSSHGSSSSGWRTRRAAKRNIAGAEEAARKAQTIVMSAAQAFGDVAAKLNRAYHQLDVE